MDYQLENLGPDRFQELCQALLVKAYPKTQCFPVGQKDGGRDAVAFVLGGAPDRFIVFQVKYSRTPLRVVDQHKWLQMTLEEEAPKLRKLIPRGAKEYYLLTNIPGTGALDSGSIDRVHKILDETLGVTAQCWWRDDINRRLDDAWDIKWAYPDILSGADVLLEIVQAGLAEDKERRTSAMRAFIRDQYDRDRQVRFKQVELQNNLMDLFIDVPMISRQEHRYRRLRSGEGGVVQQVSAGPPESEYVVSERDRHVVGAARVLLCGSDREQLQRVVLEGAPGQGKSTIVQYVCQVHRSRILANPDVLSLIPAEHAQAPVRLPFKVDLRDFSAWLDKRDPFCADEIAKTPDHWHRSLEAFLAAQVRYHSGGIEFSVGDLHAIAKLSAMLLVFDGLDEVADISKREEVVDEVTKAVNRLSESALSLQAIVTSRPAAFANSPGFSDVTFAYFELDSLDRPAIEEYSQRWLLAKRLHGREAADVTRILRDKLDLPHLRELARNPMQLAILLSLIHTRGASLPDKRTALYDSYIELFFNREAEKSAIVRDHRDLLIDIHRYLAWVLQSEAEMGQNRGIIGTDRLESLVRDYLAREQHDTSLTKVLFAGMVERVVALVSRVEGTFEFEVQPLREYFAARHLYDTAPYSPTGAEKHGTLPDRFDAIARDFYWLNATRFYAGCFSKGELPSLVDRLEELAHTDGYRHTGYPQGLCATLLSDWVFAQQPKSMRKIAALLLEEPGFRLFLASDRGSAKRGPSFVLPVLCGRDELLDQCFSKLRGELPVDFAHSLFRLISDNGSPTEVAARWNSEISQVTGSERTRWLRHGSDLGVIPGLTHEQLSSVLADGPSDSTRLMLLLASGQASFLEIEHSRFNAAVESVLAGEVEHHRPRTRSLLDLFALVVSPSYYCRSFQSREPDTLWASWVRHYGHRTGPLTEPPEIESIQVPRFEAAVKCSTMVEAAVRESSRPVFEWATHISPWDNVVETGRSLYGEKWLFYRIANIAAGIKSRQETCIACSDLLDHRRPLCSRARFARLKAGSVSWWTSQLASAKDQAERSLVALLLLTWVGPNTLMKLVDTIEPLLGQMDEHAWHQVLRAVRRAPYYTAKRQARETDVRLSALPWRLSERTVVVLGSRLPVECCPDLYKRYLRGYRGHDVEVLRFCQDTAINHLLAEPKSYKGSLEVIAACYDHGVVPSAFRPYSPRWGRWGPGSAKALECLPLKAAQEIADHAGEYPMALVTHAEQTCRLNVASEIVPVATVAARDAWFSEE